MRRPYQAAALGLESPQVHNIYISKAYEMIGKYSITSLKFVKAKTARPYLLLEALFVIAPSVFPCTMRLRTHQRVSLHLQNLVFLAPGGGFEVRNFSQNAWDVLVHHVLSYNYCTANKFKTCVFSRSFLKLTVDIPTEYLQIRTLFT